MHRPDLDRVRSSISRGASPTERQPLAGSSSSRAPILRVSAAQQRDGGRPLVVLVGAPLHRRTAASRGTCSSSCRLCCPEDSGSAYCSRISPCGLIRSLGCRMTPISSAIFEYPGARRLGAWLLARPALLRSLLSSYAGALIQRPAFAFEAIRRYGLLDPIRRAAHPWGAARDRPCLRLALVVRDGRSGARTGPRRAKHALLLRTSCRIASDGSTRSAGADAKSQSAPECRSYCDRDRSLP